MKNKHLIIVILVVFLLIIGIIGAYFIINTGNIIDEKVKNSNDATNKSQNTINNSQLNGTANELKVNTQKNNHNQNVKRPKSQSDDELVVITKKQAIINAKKLLDSDYNETTDNMARLIKVNNKHYWIISVYDSSTNLKQYDIYIDAITGKSRVPYAL